MHQGAECRLYTDFKVTLPLKTELSIDSSASLGYFQSGLANSVMQHYVPVHTITYSLKCKGNCHECSLEESVEHDE